MCFQPWLAMGTRPQGEHPGGTLESPTSRRSASTVTTQNQTVPLASMTGVRFVVVRGGLIPSELSAAGRTARMARWCSIGRGSRRHRATTRRRRARSMRTSWQAPEDGWLIVWLSGLAGAVVGWLSVLAELAAWPQGATTKQGPEEVQCGVQNKSLEPARRV